MRKTFVILWLLFAVSCFGAKLQWDANPAADAVTKYTVYRATAAAGPWAKVADVTTPLYDLAGTAPGIYFFRVTASNIWSESGPSNVVATPGNVTDPKGLIIIAVVIGADGSATVQPLTLTEFFRAAESGD